MIVWVFIPSQIAVVMYFFVSNPEFKAWVRVRTKRLSHTDIR